MAWKYEQSTGRLYNIIMSRSTRRRVLREGGTLEVVQ